MAIFVWTHRPPRFHFRVQAGVDDGSVVTAHKAESDVLARAFRLLEPPVDCKFHERSSDRCTQIGRFLCRMFFFQWREVQGLPAKNWVLPPRAYSWSVSASLLMRGAGCRNAETAKNAPLHLSPGNKPNTPTHRSSRLPREATISLGAVHLTKSHFRFTACCITDQR